MSSIAAMFDMDQTLIWKNSGLTSIQFARRHGMVPLPFLLKGIVKIMLYKFSLMNIESWYEKNISLLAGLSLQDMERFSSQWFEEMVKNCVYREGVSLIRSHERQGHRIAIVSNSPVFFVKPLANALGICETICTQVEVKGDILTGRLVKPLCYGRGKMEYASEWARKNEVDLSVSYFYTDSYYDVHLMHQVGIPVAVNPDRKLRKAALHNRWKILNFQKEPAF